MSVCSSSSRAAVVHVIECPRSKTLVSGELVCNDLSSMSIKAPWAITCKRIIFTAFVQTVPNSLEYLI